MGHRERFVILAAALVGLGLRVFVDRTWPNPVYGYQVVAGLAAIVLILLGAGLWRPRRAVAASFIAAGAGLLLGLAVGFQQRQEGPSSTLATVDLALEAPVAATMHTTSASCLVLEGRLMYLDSAEGMALVDGRRLSVTLSRGGHGPAPDTTPEDALRVDVSIASTFPDGSPAETLMGSDSTSTVTVSGTEETGTVAFSDLVLRPTSELREPIDVTGSISWACASRP